MVSTVNSIYHVEIQKWISLQIVTDNIFGIFCFFFQKRKVKKIFLRFLVFWKEITEMEKIFVWILDFLKNKEQYFWIFQNKRFGSLNEHYFRITPKLGIIWKWTVNSDQFRSPEPFGSEQLIPTSFKAWNHLECYSKFRRFPKLITIRNATVNCLLRRRFWNRVSFNHSQPLQDPIERCFR